MWRRIFALTVKEFLALLKDKKSRMVVIIPPLLQLIVFGYAATFDLKDVPYAVYNEDSGSASREFLSRFKGSQNFTEVAILSNERQIAPLINRKEALLVVHIGPDFSRNILKGDKTPVQVIVDGRNSNTAMLALNYAKTIGNDFNRAWSKRSGGTGPPGRARHRFAGRTGSREHGKARRLSAR